MITRSIAADLMLNKDDENVGDTSDECTVNTNEAVAADKICSVTDITRKHKITVSQAIDEARILSNKDKDKVATVKIGNIPPLYAKTVDEIDICPPCNETVTDEGILCEGCST